MENDKTIPDLIIDRYEILTAFDEGENVFLVRDRKTRELFVEKVVSARSLALYQYMRDVSLQGVPAIYCIEPVNGKMVVIEEYIHGLNLMQLVLNDGPLSERDLVSYMIQLCHILDQFHSMSPPLIHRDIKPGNLILDSNSRIYLIDFNIAREYNPDSSRDTVYMVSHHFSAPEAYGFGQTDMRSDIYGIGATMHYLLTGGYLNETFYEGSLKEIIDNCTMMEPESRCQSVAELLASLERWRHEGDAEGLQGYDSNLDFDDKDDQKNHRGRRDHEKQGNHGDNRNQKNHRNQENHREGGFKSFLPPGFRSGTPANMLIAVAIYGLTIWMCLSMRLESMLSKPFSYEDQWLQRIGTLTFFLGSILLLFDYRQCLERLPGISGIRSGILKRIVAIFILFSVILAVLVINVYILLNI